MSALARFDGIAKSYDHVVALRSLDLEVRAGEVFGLLGPNGAGKTTALRILCGLLEPTAGRVLIGAHDAHREPLLARREFSFVPDGAPLYANLSFHQHLTLVGRLHGLDAAHLSAEVVRLAAALDLGDRLHDPIGEFSRGMRQKTALACAILPRPPLLILDEPLTGLDATTTSVFKAVLKSWALRGGAVLYTSHLLDVAERVCDRIAILSEGSLVGMGTLEELRTLAGQDGTLEQVFGVLTRAEDPAAVAQRLLGHAPA